MISLNPRNSPAPHRQIGCETLRNCMACLNSADAQKICDRKNAYAASYGNCFHHMILMQTLGITRDLEFSKSLQKIEALSRSDIKYTPCFQSNFSIQRSCRKSDFMTTNQFFILIRRSGARRAGLLRWKNIDVGRQGRIIESIQKYQQISTNPTEIESKQWRVNLTFLEFFGWFSYFTVLPGSGSQEWMFDLHLDTACVDAGFENEGHSIGFVMQQEAVVKGRGFRQVGQMTCKAIKGCSRGQIHDHGNG